MRLAKYLAHAGVASRRASEVLIEQGRVHVDGGLVTTPVFFVEPGMKVYVDGELLGSTEERGGSVVYMLNKPIGVVSTANDPQGRPTVIDYAPPESGRVYPVGRLDLESSGLLLLTNDGDLAHRLTHPSFEVPKTYRVRVGKPPLSRKYADLLRHGVELDDGITLPTQVTQLGPAQFEITLREGRNRQVRRMCEAVGHPVKELRRIRFAELELGHLLEGGVRRLRAPEVDALRQLASTQSPPPPEREGQQPASRRGPAGGRSGRPMTGRGGGGGRDGGYQGGGQSRGGGANRRGR